MSLVGGKMLEGIHAEGLAPGEILERRVVHSLTESGHNYDRRYVKVGDESTPEGRAILNNRLNLLNDEIVKHPEWLTAGSDQSNPASDEFYQSFLVGTSIQYWRDTFMPHAPALYPLQRTADAGRWFPDNYVDPYAMDIFINAIDSVAIRARGSIHNSILFKKAAEFPGNSLIAVALGVGAGVPNIEATIKIRDLLGKTIHWKEYDLSYNSLEKSKELFSEANIPQDDVEAFRADYKKAFALESESVDIVDMLGLWEYLTTEQCIEAVKKLYKILKPGGVFVISNMLLDRPQLEVNQGVIRWPGVKPRSIDELIEIAVAAGMDTNAITITTSDDGVYAVMEIHKP